MLTSTCVAVTSRYCQTDLAEVRDGSGGHVRENTHCKMWFSLSLWDLDVMAHTPWPRALLYAFPQLQLIHPLLKRIRQERLSLILIALEGCSALWFPELVALSCVTPPVRPDALSQAHGSIHHPPNLSGWLLVWLTRMWKGKILKCKS